MAAKGFVAVLAMCRLLTLTLARGLDVRGGMADSVGVMGCQNGLCRVPGQFPNYGNVTRKDGFICSDLGNANLSVVVATATNESPPRSVMSVTPDYINWAICAAPGQFSPDMSNGTKGMVCTPLFPAFRVYSMEVDENNIYYFMSPKWASYYICQVPLNDITGGSQRCFPTARVATFATFKVIGDWLFYTNSGFKDLCRVQIFNPNLPPQPTPICTERKHLVSMSPEFATFNGSVYWREVEDFGLSVICRTKIEFRTGAKATCTGTVPYPFSVASKLMYDAEHNQFVVVAYNGANKSPTSVTVTGACRIPANFHYQEHWICTYKLASLDHVLDTEAGALLYRGKITWMLPTAEKVLVLQCPTNFTEAKPEECTVTESLDLPPESSTATRPVGQGLLPDGDDFIFSTDTGVCRMQLHPLEASTLACSQHISTGCTPLAPV